MPRTQTIVQLSDELLAELDELRAPEGRSRSELIRDALERYLAEHRQHSIDLAIVEAYTRVPPADDFGAMAAARASIAAERWDDVPAAAEPVREEHTATMGDRDTGDVHERSVRERGNLSDVGAGPVRDRDTGGRSVPKVIE